MRFKRLILSLTIFCFSLQIVYSQDLAQTEKDNRNNFRRHSIGSSVFVLGNLASGDSPNFFLLNYGYQVAPKSIVFSEVITWTYYEPLGTYGSSEESYPGKIKAYGIGIGYKRFYWKKAYSTVQVTPFLQQFYDSSQDKIENGFQLYLQARIGYQFEVFNNHWFIEPSVAFNYWPVNTNFPESFKKIEKGKPDYFLFEPGLHIGFKF